MGRAAKGDRSGDRVPRWLAKTVTIYDPTIGTAAVETRTAVESLELIVSDHPLIVAIDPIRSERVEWSGLPGDSILGRPPRRRRGFPPRSARVSRPRRCATEVSFGPRLGDRVWRLPD